MTLRSYRLVGLTGQTGAGKSAVAMYLWQRGFTVLNADKMVADVYRESPVCLKAVAACFGEDILKADGSLDRPVLAKRAFSSPENTALLGKIVHPFVIAETLRLLKTVRGMVVLDAPQLFESSMDVLCDCIVSVTAPEKIRLDRILKRDNITAEQARERMNAQLDERFFRKHTDYLIENNADLPQLYARLDDLIHTITTEVM